MDWCPEYTLQREKERSARTRKRGQPVPEKCPKSTCQRGTVTATHLSIKKSLLTNTLCKAQKNPRVTIQRSCPGEHTLETSRDAAEFLKVGTKTRGGLLPGRKHRIGFW